MSILKSRSLLTMVFGLLLLSACDRQPPSAGSTASAGNTGTALVKFKVLAAPVGFQPLFVGKSQGIFEKHGIDLEISQDLVTAAEAVPQALSGKYQAITTSLIPLAQAVGSGIRIKAIASGLNDEPGKPSIGGLLVLKDSPIKAAADLGGKTVAVNGLGTSLQVAVMQVAARAGVDPKSIKFVNVPYNGMVQAALNRNVDAIYSLENFRQQALDKGFVQISEPLKEAFPNSSWILYAMTNEYIRDNPQTVTKFVAALSEASVLANKNPELVRAVDRERTKLPVDYIDNRVIPPFNTRIDAGAIKNQFEVALKYGVVSKLPEIDKIIATKIASISRP